MRGLVPDIHVLRHFAAGRTCRAGSSSAIPSERWEGEKTSILQRDAKHRYRRRGAVAGDVGIEPVAAQRALDPEVAGHLVDQVARDRVDLVAAAVALVVERTPGELSDGSEPAAEIVIGFHGVDVPQHGGDAR